MFEINTDLQRSPFSMAKVKDGNGNHGGDVGGMSDADMKNLGSATRPAQTTQNDIVNATQLRQFWHH